jgi:hypothetical protein
MHAGKSADTKTENLVEEGGRCHHGEAYTIGLSQRAHCRGRWIQNRGGTKCSHRDPSRVDVRFRKISNTISQKSRESTGTWH